MHSPKLQDWSLTMRLFYVISRTLVRGESYISVKIQLVYSTALADWAQLFKILSLWKWKRLRKVIKDSIISFLTSQMTRIKLFHNQAIGLMSKVFADRLGDQFSIPGRVILKTRKMVLDAVLLNTQHYKVRIKGKEEQSREWNSALPYTWVS